MADTFTIRLPRKMRADLARISKEQGVPLSALVRESLARFVRIQEFERTRAEFIPYARAAGYFTEEDILKIDS